MSAQKPRDEELGERGSIVNISSIAGVMSSPGIVAMESVSTPSLG
jgi:short-subunit dehydrogenase